MPGFEIHTVQNDVYFCDSYSYDTEGRKPDGTGVTLVLCKPTNGTRRGKLHKFPLGVVTHIVDTSGEEEV